MYQLKLKINRLANDIKNDEYNLINKWVSSIKFVGPILHYLFLDIEPNLIALRTFLAKQL